VEQRLSLVTLGVRDLARARRFYEVLGWTSGAAPADDVVFFQAGCMIVALWGRGQLVEDTAVEDSEGWGGVTLAYNARSPAEVDSVLAEPEAAGAAIPRRGAETFWGGYSGVFVDPEGHPWEVAHNPLDALRGRSGQPQRRVTDLDPTVEREDTRVRGIRTTDDLDAIRSAWERLEEIVPLRGRNDPLQRRRQSRQSDLECLVGDRE
jgi:predicted lactoylglutathione lyase